MSKNMPKTAVIDSEHRDKVTCPHCGHEARDSVAIFVGLGIDDSTDVSCGACDRSFMAERNITITYSSRKLVNETREMDEKG